MRRIIEPVTTAQQVKERQDAAARHQEIQDEHVKGAGEAGEASSMGYPNDERLNTEMACGGSPVEPAGEANRIKSPAKLASGKITG